MTDNVQENRIAIVTGGSRGLGRSTAVNLARRGIDVILTYQSNKAEAEGAVAEIFALGRRAAALLLDVGDTQSFSDFAARVSAQLGHWGTDRFDYLVNNAGHNARGVLGQITEADFDGLMNVHFKGVLFLTQAMLPLMRDGGSIVNISSGLARFAHPGSLAYGSMKGAVEVMTRYMAQELGPRGITVNVVAPGAIETDFGGAILRNNPQVKEMVRSMTALGRTGVAEDVGPMVASLLSEANRWVTAQRIEVSGGQQL
jgi:NAD(P)-dependent dehydrogenase (short-subunit alcohol dehydrogenase family)